MKTFTVTRTINSMKRNRVEVETILERNAYADVEIAYVDEITWEVTATCYRYIDTYTAKSILAKWANRG